MCIPRRKTSCILGACIIVATLAILTAWIAYTLDPYPLLPVKGLHENAAALASSICPNYDCDQVGWGTKQLSNDNSGQILERWCVEVIYTKKQTAEKGKAAVEVILIDIDKDNPDNWQIANTEYGADCTTMK